MQYVIRQPDGTYVRDFAFERELYLEREAKRREELILGTIASYTPRELAIMVIDLQREVKIYKKIQDRCDET